MNAQRIEAKTSNRRDSFIMPDHVMPIFKSLHELFDSLKRNKESYISRARQFMAQPLYILAGFYNIQKALYLYGELFPELHSLQVVPLRVQPRIMLNEEVMSFDPIDYLCDSFELDLVTKKEVYEPLLTNTQRNKLK